jgi:hypothetical protein
MTKLSIIVLSFNTKDYLKQTLESIKKNKDWELIVVDNGSSDGSPEMVKKRYPHARLIETGRNLGFAGGNNVGIKEAKGKHVMLLNSDTVVIDDALEKMVAYLDKHKDVGAIGPKFVLSDGGIDLACHRGEPTPWNALAYFLKLEQMFPTSKLFAGYHRTWEDFDTVHEVPIMSAGAMIVRKEVIDEVGYLDDNFFLYAEDIDWCKRIHDAGWKLIYFPKSKIIHHKSKSGKAKEGLAAHKTKSFSNYYFFDTMKQYYEKHYSHHPFWFRRFVKFGVDLVSMGASRKEKK